jgi:hypothetical protein
MYVDAEVILAGLMVMFPGRTNKEYGAMVGYGERTVRDFRRRMAEKSAASRRLPPRGFKSKDGDFEAWAEE